MKKLLLAILIILLYQNFTLADILLTPYLQSLSTNSIYVLVECNTTSAVTVNYGLTPSYGNTATTESYMSTTSSPLTYVHRIKLNGLTANTLYYYNAVQGNTTSGGSTFKTAITGNTNFRFAWFADCRSGVSVHDQISPLILAANPLFSIYGGDYCIDATYASWKSEFFRTNELNSISKIPFFGIAGNHEGWSTNTQAFFRNPDSPSGTQDYYSFTIGNMHVLVINNQISYALGSAQYNFAMSDLSSNNSQWKIVATHNPAYCSGGHNEDAQMIAMSQNIFLPNHVDLVISGHSHFYQHNLVSGLHHMVIGTTGAPQYVPSNASYTVKSVQDYCFSVIDVTPTNFNMFIYNNLNNKLDSLKLYKNPQEIQNENNSAQGFVLYQNYPNPFNPATTIKFSIPEKIAGINSSNISCSLKVYDEDGKEITTLLNQNLTAGDYETSFDGSEFSSGIYFYKLEVGNYSQTKRMLLIK